jgi:hypothetical protein
MALVDHGANQTPWNSVKNVRGAKPAKETEMGVKGKGSKAPASKLTKMQFSKDKFKTIKSVKDYLAENNIEGAGAVEDGDDIWIVKSTEDFDGIKLGKARATATKVDGATAFIAPVLAADEEDELDTTSKSLREGGDDEGEDDESEEGEEGEDDEEDETGEAEEEPQGRKAASKVKTVDGSATKVRRAPKPKKATAEENEPEEVEPVLELAEKYDWWGAYTSGSDSLLGVLKDGMDYDNVPPGMEDVMMAMYTTIGNVLSDDGKSSSEKLSTLKQAGEELAALTVGLFDLFSQATEDASKSLKPSVRKSAKKFADSFAESVARLAEGDFSNIVNVDNGEDASAKRKSASNEADDIGPAGRAIIKTLEKRLDKLSGELAATNKTLRRSPAQRSMSDSISEIVDEDELEDEDEGGYDQNRLEEVRRSLGLRPTVTKQPVAV